MGNNKKGWGWIWLLILALGVVLLSHHSGFKTQADTSLSSKVRTTASKPPKRRANQAVPARAKHSPLSRVTIVSYGCGPGYTYSSNRLKLGRCRRLSLPVHPGDTVGGIAEKLGHYGWRGELCYVTPRFKFHLPGRFNYRRLRSGPGYSVGGCP